MKVRSISYRRTVNLGDYNSETLEMTADVDDNEYTMDAYKLLKHHVHFNLGITKSEPAPLETESTAHIVEEVKANMEAEAKEEPKKVTKKKVAKKKVTKKVEKKVEEPKQEYTLDEIKLMAQSIAKKKGVQVIKIIIKEVGADKVADIDPAKYGEFMAKAEKCLA